ncbi:MAG TPA: PAS domain-containing sensor histidine kinase, partial [Bacteroidetes bacterium]|nr:PAS domain-containing sensor histidine kinase [Bacteroidota bacterium]
LRQRLAAMGSLASGVAREIRNPLNTVTMAAQRLDREFTPVEDAEEYHRLLHSMRGESSRIERIIEEFLRFARPPELVLTLGSLEVALGELAETFRPSCEARGVRFEVDLQPVPEFPFDSDQVKQAALNLLRNALDAAPDEGGIVRLVTRATENGAVIEVEDNGPGIPEEERGRIFDLYFTTKPDGTGVGLAMVHRIAVEHGGRVEVDDSPLAGAAFRIMLTRD